MAKKDTSIILSIHAKRWTERRCRSGLCLKNFRKCDVSHTPVEFVIKNGSPFTAQTVCRPFQTIQLAIWPVPLGNYACNRPNFNNILLKLQFVLQISCNFIQISDCFSNGGFCVRLVNWILWIAFSISWLLRRIPWLGHCLIDFFFAFAWERKKLFCRKECLLRIWYEF